MPAIGRPLLYVRRRMRSSFDPVCAGRARSPVRLSRRGGVRQRDAGARHRINKDEVVAPAALLVLLAVTHVAREPPPVGRPSRVEAVVGCDRASQPFRLRVEDHRPIEGEEAAVRRPRGPDQRGTAQQRGLATALEIQPNGALRGRRDDWLVVGAAERRLTTVATRRTRRVRREREEPAREFVRSTRWCG